MKNDSLTLFEESKEERLALLIQDLKACRACEARFGFEPHPIQWGAPDAKVLIVSQAPGWRVHEIGKPFSDLSGKKLRQKWFGISEAQFYDPHSFYFTNAGHCFPGQNKNHTDKKPPKMCWEKWSKHEVELLDQCKLYIVIGSEAASRMFPGRKLEDLVFADLTVHGKPCFVLPHPSPLNFRWPQAHPTFETDVLPRLRQAIAQALSLPADALVPYTQKESWESNNI